MPPPPPLFLSLPSPPPPPLPVHLPKAAQTLALSPSAPARKTLPVCSVASPRHSGYFDPRAPPPPPRGDGYGRPPPAPHANGGQDGRVFTSYSIYKGKAALSFDPRPPQFVPLDSGAYKVAKEGFVLLQFAPAVATRQYDWTRKQVFSLSVWEIGTLLTLGPTDSCEFFHDPFKGRSEEGKVRKVLKVEPTPDGNGRFFNLSVQNRLLNIDESIYIPITKGEFAVIVSTFNYIIPHLMGWSVFTSSIKPEDSRPYNRPQSTPEYEWRR
ncbi:single-stranded DNA-binding protein WHY1, chloroplastic-like [Phragmites australis]|uniref:single-stranded DNA-binding protein WHY1, chloroplastic-like n=1 Tax=Phragmites australis TaxID=29695 RepID=UPI002D76BA18|nr:single-stranded DNA-binding protein WHY1, chloroplastic-like [Phragmites australis]